MREDLESCTELVARLEFTPCRQEVICRLV